MSNLEKELAALFRAMNTGRDLDTGKDLDQLREDAEQEIFNFLFSEGLHLLQARGLAHAMIVRITGVP